MRGICLAVIALWLLPNLGAATINWTGGGGNADWTNAGNWNPATVPAANDSVIFGANAGTMLSPVTNIPAVLQQIVVTGGATVYLRPMLNTVTLTAPNGLEVNSGGTLRLLQGPVLTVSTNVVVNAGTLLVHPGATLTITTSLYVYGAAASFGAHEDGTDAATAGLFATINYNGDARVDVGDGLVLGEGIHNFSAIVDLGATAVADQVVLPPQRTDNDVQPQIHLLNNVSNHEVKFSPNGSKFFVTSVTGGTRVTQTGRMILVGAFDVSNATAGAVFTAWTTADPVQVGDGTIVLQIEILTSNGRVEWGDVLFVDLGNGSNPATPTTRSTISMRAGAAGRFVFDSMEVEGDNFNHFNNQDENNSPQVTVQNCVIEVANDLILADGSEDGDAGGTGGGGTLIARGATLECFILQVGDDSAAGANGAKEGASLLADTGTLFDFADNGIFDQRPYTLVSANGCTFTGMGVVTFSVISSAARIELVHCTVSAGTSNNLTIFLGSQDLRVLDTIFSNYTMLGVQFAAGTIISKLDSNHFLLGQSGGTHISFNGLGNATKVNCDGNQFDDSTQPYTLGNHIVKQNFTPNLVNFRVAGNDFGEGPFSLLRATAEAQDDDNGASDPTQVAWQENVNTLDVTALSAPTQVVSAISDGLSNQTAMLFQMQAIGGDAVIDSVRFYFESLSGDIVPADVGYVTLFNDADSSGTFGAGEDFVGTASQNSADEPFNGVSILFDLAGIGVPAVNRTITASSLQRWGVSITFLAGAAGHGGQLRARIEIGDLDDANGNLILGLPIQNVLEVTGPVDNIVVIQQPSLTPQDTIIAPPPIVELRDAAGRAVKARSYNVTASIFQGTAGATLSGTLATPSSTLNGRATFSNLRINLAGSNYVLRFTAQAKNGDSTTFTISGTNPPGPQPLPGGNGGGCACYPQSLPAAPLAAMLAILLAAALVLRQRRA